MVVVGSRHVHCWGCQGDSSLSHICLHLLRFLISGLDNFCQKYLRNEFLCEKNLSMIRRQDAKRTIFISQDIPASPKQVCWTMVVSGT